MTAPNHSEAQVRDFISQYLRQHGYAPSVREIKRAIGFKSTSTVHYHLRKLEKAGSLRREPYRARAILLLK